MTDAGEEKIDQGAYDEFVAANKRIGDKWPDGAQDILEQRNPELLSEFYKQQSILDSLVLIKSKPAPLKKQWREALAEYERTGEQCIIYAKRHLPAVTK